MLIGTPNWKFLYSKYAENGLNFSPTAESTTSAAGGRHIFARRSASGCYPIQVYTLSDEQETDGGGGGNIVIFQAAGSEYY